MEKLGNYFNSELNKYIGENLPKIMTSIDLDLLQVKKAKKIIRFAEYKHEEEGVGYQQNESLKLMARFAKVINRHPEMFGGWKCEVCLIRGNVPYDKLTIYCFVNETTQILTNKKDIDNFLTLE